MKRNWLYWVVPGVLVILQAIMTINSLNQMRFEEFIESVQAPFWFDQRQVINGLHVNVGWYAYLLILYKLFGFSLHTGKMAYLVMTAISAFTLAYFLRKFFDLKTAALILTTVLLSPTMLYMNALDLHWAMTFHFMIVILLVLHVLDFRKKHLSLILTGLIFFLMMIAWFFYQAFVFYIPSLVIFYILKLKRHFSYGRGTFVQETWQHLAVSAIAFLLPLVLLFVYVDNKQMLIYDPDTGTGLFRGGGKFEFSDQVFSQAWTDFISDFFIKGISHHFEVAQAEFSLIFPIITLLFMIYALYKVYTAVYKMKHIILLAGLVIGFDAVVFSTTSDLGLPGMKRVTPMLFSIYFLWVIVWYYLGRKKKLAYLVLSLLIIHHLIVYPINLIHVKDPSPFKMTDWFDETNPQKSLDEYVNVAQKQDLMLDCRPIVAQAGQCSYDFIYPAVAGSCKWNNLNCHSILGYDTKTGQFISLTTELWSKFYFEY